MQRFRRNLLVMSALLLAGGCARPVPQTAAGIDWAQAPVVRIVLDVGFFHPGRVTLRLRQPVRLVFQNGGGRTHDFVTNLFTAVQQRPGTRQGRVRVILQPIETVEYDIVPQIAGTYSLYTVMFEPANGVPPVRILVK